MAIVLLPSSETMAVDLGIPTRTEATVQELIEFIARSLVDDPTQVEVTEFHRGAQAVLNLRVAKEDMGRIIGKSGRVASAMRTLLRVAAVQEGKRASLDIVEPE